MLDTVKNPLLLLFVSFLGLTAWGQETIDFDMSFQPNVTRIVKNKNVIISSMEFGGTEEALARIKERGLENPTVVKDSSSNTARIVYGPMKDGRISSVSTVLESDDPTNKIGSITYAQIEDGVIRIDSILDGSNGMINEDIKELTNEVMSQYDLPSKTMSIGDSLVTEQPISIDLQNFIVELNMKSYYVLKEIKDGKAHFDIALEYEMISDIEEIDLNLEGMGTGFLVYNIDGKFQQDYTMQSDMTIKIVGFGAEMKVGLSSARTQTVEQFASD